MAKQKQIRPHVGGQSGERAIGGGDTELAGAEHRGGPGGIPVGEVDHLVAELDQAAGELRGDGVEKGAFCPGAEIADVEDLHGIHRKEGSSPFLKKGPKTFAP